MGKNLTENSLRREYHLIPVGEIAAPTDWNGRHFGHDPKTIRNLAESILTQGQLQPVIVRKNKETGEIALSAGFCRYLAIKLINEDKELSSHLNGEELFIKAIREDQSDADAFVLNLRENKDRKATSLIDDAYNHQRLRKEFGWTNIKIATEYHCTAVWVGQLSKLLKLSADIQKRVHSGEIPPSIAIQLADLSPEDQDDVIAQAEADGVSLKLDDVKDKIRESRANGDDGDNVARSLKQIRKYLESVKTDKKEDDSATSTLANDFLRFINGRIGEKGMENAWTRYRNSVCGK